MRPRPDLIPESTIVKSNPNTFYVDEKGRVAEIEDDADCILFGTVNNSRWISNSPVNLSIAQKKKEKSPRNPEGQKRSESKWKK